MNSTRTTGAERLLRGLAAGDDGLLRSVLVPGSAETMPPAAANQPLPPVTATLVHLAALLAVGGSTTSLRWAVEMAVRAGAQDEELVEVLATVAPAVGSARVVTAAPRLALAIGYDIEVEGWDGN